MFTDEPQEIDSPVTESEPEVEEVVEEVAEAEPETDWQAEALKWKAIAKRHAKDKEQVPSQDKAGLTEYDVIALKNSSITEKEDLDTVKDLAKKLNLSIADALDDKYIKTVLAEKAEERRTARATETRSPRGIAKSSGADYLRKAESAGELPETMDAMRQLAEARLERKKR
jgi:hypothetical protein